MIPGPFVREVPLNGPLYFVALEPGGACGTRDFVLVRQPDGMSLPFGFSDHARSVLARSGGVEVLSSGSALLNNFLTLLLRVDPDLIIGHRPLGLGLDVLLTRMNTNLCQEWSRFGHLIKRRNLSRAIHLNNEIFPGSRAMYVRGD
ncbi:DNA polymerase alpha catalytic subunit [Gracilariopsis chorda]|uniref:DNA polymerase alpha catalytic subunit n=1 Tax=Gracilariopsis chorda TaxID=448386 RepID=A0A2V3IL70_9FLOR|nr:DNA polymerase alpha catalytic subunit [Gracilariopsis chorda]|eukprot:PXF42826.1 DNA polymerase alpha catalytic subunit [Gracilariopsis chorda]